MTRQELLRLFEVDENGLVQSEGPFAGQPLFVPYFWFLYLTGYVEEQQGEVVTFWVRAEDRTQFPELASRSVVRMRRRADGRIVEKPGTTA